MFAEGFCSYELMNAVDWQVARERGTQVGCGGNTHCMETYHLGGGEGREGGREGGREREGKQGGREREGK